VREDGVFTSVKTVAVYVTDTDRALRFWTEVLGFELRVRVHPGLAFLQTPDGVLHVYLEGGHRPATAGPDTARLGFFLEAEATAAETFARLRDAGADLIQKAPEQVDDTTYVFQLRDPDGNVLDVVGS
jgi:predicted enzyme related to lactoylglutathione lyase